MASRIRRHRWLAAAVLLGLALPALWLVRDLPRRRIEGLLSTRLGAQVQVGRLVVHDSHWFELDGVTIRRVSLVPILEQLQIGRIEARGPLLDMAEGRFTSLVLADVTVWLTPAAAAEPAALPAAVPAATDLAVDRLRLERAVVVVPTAGDECRIAVEAELSRIREAELDGTVRAAADQVSLPAVAALLGGESSSSDVPAGIQGRIEGLLASLVISDRGRRLAAEAAATRLLLQRPGHSMTVEQPALKATALRDDTTGQVRVEVDPHLPFLDAAQATSVLQADGSIEELHVSLGGLQVQHWLLPWLGLPEAPQLRGTADVTVRTATGGGYTGDALIRLTELAIATPETVPVLAGTVSVTGTLAPDAEGGWQGPVDATFELDSPLRWRRSSQTLFGGLLPVGGRLQAQLSTCPSLEFAGKLRISPRDAGHLAASGSLQNGQLTADWSWSGCRPQRLLDLAAAAGLQLPGNVEVHADVQARGTVSGDLLRPRLAGSLILHQLTTAGGPVAERWAGRVARTTLELDWQPPANPATLALTVPEATIQTSGLAPVSAAITGSATLDPSAGQLHIARLLIDAGDLGRIGGQGTISGKRQWSARLDLSGAEVEPWHRILQPPAGDLFRDATLAGSATAELVLAGSGNRTWSAEGTAILTGVGYSSRDGSRVIEGLGLNAELHLDQERQATIRARAEARIVGPLLLWDTVFADLSTVQLPLTVELERTDGYSGRLQCIPDQSTTLSVVLETDNRIGSVLWQAELRADDLQTTIDNLLRRPLQGSVPAVDKLQIAGAAHAALAGVADDNHLSVTGRISLHGVTAGSGGDWLAVNGLELDLPVDLELLHGNDATSSADRVTGARQHGSLSFASLALDRLALPATSVPLQVHGDSIGIGDLLSVPLLGGFVDLEQLTLAELLHPTRHLETGVILRDIDLAELSRDLGLVPLDGVLAGAFPRVSLNRDMLRVEGDGRLSLFGGTVTVSDISGRDLLSRYPQLVFSSDLSGIDLAQLTAAFDFGEISGSLSGWLHDCELFQGIPVRLQGRFETSPAPGQPQVISLKAINNIAIVGTGGVGPLDRGIHRFLRSYRYERIGIEMRLDNDHFLLRGLEHRGDQELFLKGKGLFRIDVVNMQPGATVSFRTMLERLRNLDVSAVRTGSREEE